ncbi:MAG: ABC transporter permease [Bacteroidota bacterium]
MPNSKGMIKHYLRIGSRNFIKYRTSSVINAVGLSLAICCCLFTFSFIYFFYNADSHHENGDAIYAINRFVQLENDEQLTGGSPTPLVSALKENHSQVIRSTRFNFSSAYVRFGENVFEETIRFAQPDFLRMFSYEMEAGSERAIDDPNGVVLAKRTAEKYFDDQDPIGKEIEVKFIANGVETIKTYLVTGVAAEFPHNASFRFTLLANDETLISLGLLEESDWSTNNAAGFIQLSNPESIDVVANMANGDFLDRLQTHTDQKVISSYQFESFLTSSLNSENIRNSVFNGTSIAAFITLSTLSLLLMSLACINYMNIAIASAAYRLKEIGIRKVIGGSRKALVIQFLSENVIICLLALGLGIALTELVALPAFNSIGVLRFENDYFGNPLLMSFVGAILMISIVGGAGYPALYISKFQPHTILKGKLKFGGNNRFRKGLLAVQYFFSFLTIIVSVVLLQNDQHQYTIDWGYDKENVVAIKVKGENNYEKLASKMRGLPTVKSVAGSRDLVGRNLTQLDYQIDENNYQADHIRLGPGYLATLNLQPLEGRLFDPNRISDQKTIVINQKMKAAMGWDDPLSEYIEFGEERYYVIGVVPDFHYRPFYAEIDPLVVSLADPSDCRYLIAKVEDGQSGKQEEAFKSAWLSLFPNDPFNFQYQDQVFDNSFYDLQIVSRLISSISLAAVILTAIGLFGLAAIHMRSKLKEISIRKVLGSGMAALGFSLNKEFIYLLLGASVIGIPVSYKAVEVLLESLTHYPKPMTIWPFILTTVILILMSVIAMGGHIYKVLRVNSAENLRNE